MYPKPHIHVKNPLSGYICMMYKLLLLGAILGSINLVFSKSISEEISLHSVNIVPDLVVNNNFHVHFLVFHQAFYSTQLHPQVIGVEDPVDIN